MTIHRSVRALSRGLALIGELNTSGPSSAQELARKSGLNRTTCYRLLQTLQQEGYVTFDDKSALFGLTPQVRRLSEGLSTQDLSRQAALPPMFSLLEQVSWPSDFAVFELGFMMIRESTHSFSPFSVHRSMVGLGRSLVRSALGRAVLTAATPAQRREMLEICASLVPEDAALARDRRYVSRFVARTRSRWLCLVGRRDRARHQRHRRADRRRRTGDRQSQHRVLHLGDDSRGCRHALPTQPEAGRPRHRTSLADQWRGPMTALPARRSAMQGMVWTAAIGPQIWPLLERQKSQ